MTNAATTSAGRVRKRRNKMRASSLRPVQIWVPDTRAAGFAEECSRQARLIRLADDSETRAEDQAWAAVPTMLVGGLEAR